MTLTAGESLGRAVAVEMAVTALLGAVCLACSNRHGVVVVAIILKQVKVVAIAQSL